MKRLSILGLVVLTACGGGGGGSTPITPAAAAPETVVVSDLPKTPKQPAAVEAPQPCRVIIYGDSLIADPLLTEKVHERIARLRPDWVVVNRAVGGQRWAQGAPQLWGDGDLKGAKVVLEWGVNDSKLGAPLDLVPQAIAHVKEAGGTPILTGVVAIAGLYTQAYNQKLFEYAVEGGAAWVSWNERSITTFDGTHPDQPSTDLLTDDLINTLDKECQ